MALSPYDRRAISRWDPFQEMRSMRDAMDRLIESTFGGSSEGWSASALSMPIDISETDDRYRIEASMPGVKPDDVRISVNNNVITMEAERKESHEPEEASAAATPSIDTDVFRDQSRCPRRSMPNAPRPNFTMASSV